MTLATAIDLGASWVSLGLSDGERVAIPTRGKTPLRIPAWVALDAEGRLIAGERAWRLGITRPRMVVPAVAGLLGRRFDGLDPADFAPLALQRGPVGDVRVRLGERTYAAPRLAAALLAEIRVQAEELLGEPLGPAVLAVPAHAGDAYRRALADAAAIAGVDLARMVHATTAAALLYRAERVGIGDEIIAVCDLGGGRFDASIVAVGDAGVEVLAHRGVDDVGGADMDLRIVEWLRDAVVEQAGEAALADPTVRVRLRDVAQKSRVALSSARDAAIHLPFLFADEVGTRHLHTKITQAKMEALVKAPIDRCVEALQQALADAGREPAALAEIVLVGGAARMPLFQDRVEAILRRAPHTRYLGGEAVARGAALYAAVLRGQRELQVVDILGREIVLEREGVEPEVVIQRAAPLPASHTELIELAEPPPGAAEAPPAVFRVHEGVRSPALVAACTLRGRPAIDLTFAVDASGRLALEYRQWARGKEAVLTVEERCVLDDAERQELVTHERALEEAARRQARAEDLQLRLAGWIERGDRVLAELGEGLPAGAREHLQLALRSARDARVADTDTALEAADAAFEALASELPPAVQQALRGPPVPPPPPRADPLGPLPLVKRRAADIDLEAEAAAAEGADAVDA